ncbi:hypothetical protein Tco_1302047 [Tanacetum coccineum]
MTDMCDVPNCDNNRVNVESELVESLINRDTLIVYSSKIDPILEDFGRELAHIAPIPPGIVEADFNQNDDTSSDDDDFEDIEYVSLDEVDQEEKEFDLEDILQIQDVTLREKLLNVSRLISNIESLKDNPSPVMDSDSSITSLSFSNNSLPEFESFSDQTGRDEKFYVCLFSMADDKVNLFNITIRRLKCMREKGIPSFRVLYSTKSLLEEDYETNSSESKKSVNSKDPLTPNGVAAYLCIQCGWHNLSSRNDDNDLIPLRLVYGVECVCIDYPIR